MGICKKRPESDSTALFIRKKCNPEASMSRLPDSDFKEIKDDSELQLGRKLAFLDTKCFLA